MCHDKYGSEDLQDIDSDDMDTNDANDANDKNDKIIQRDECEIMNIYVYSEQ
jgi:hypothetical protein